MSTISHLLLRGLLLALSMFSLGFAAEPLVDLDAEALPAGALSKLENRGSLGGSLTPGKSAPLAAAFEGRQALVFDGGADLTASFPLPEMNAFTVEAWAANPSIDRIETLFSILPAKGGMGLEFNFGQSSNAGAFRAGFKQTAGFEPLPAQRAWHHIAWSYDGAARALKIFVDGELNATRTFMLATPPQARLYLGCSGESNVLRQPFTGALARLRVFKGALSQDEVRRSGKWIGAYAPTPRDGSVTDSLSAALQWASGNSGVALSKLYFGTEREAVLRGDAETLKASAAATSAGPILLKLGAVHYWRVSEFDKDGKEISPGVVWSFQADAGRAASPAPRDQNSNVPVAVPSLSWKPGKYATKQYLYFGTDRSAVESGKAARTELEAGAASLPIPGGKLDAGTRYFWKIDNDNGAQPPTRGHVWTFRTQDAHVPNDVTFFVSSDTHYGRENNAELNRATIDVMNALPGTPMPEIARGEIVRTPRGVVLNGDLLDDGTDPKNAPGHWKDFCNDYGLSGDDGRLCVPVYEGFGNHDGGPTRSITRAGIKERNPKRVGLTAISENGLHYSWDWDHVHLVQLNLFGGSGPEDVQNVNQKEHDPQDAFGFLKQDLEKHVGKSGRWVIVFQHFSVLGGMADWWNAVAKGRMYDLLKNYNAACLINGHSHGASFTPWNELLTIHDGATARPESGTGDFMVVRVTEKELIVAQRKRESWGITLRKPLGKPE